MGFRVLLLISAIFLAIEPAFAREECPFTGADATMDAIKATPTCAAAAAIYGRCTWGSSMDVQFGQPVIGKCEAEFAGRLSKKDNRAYDRAQKRCIDKYAHKEGTLYMSFSMSCAVDIAKDYAKRFGKPKSH
jgi:dienelactone hydrolase